MTGPVWTQARLRRVMALAFGSTATGHVDTHAVADAMGVSVRTVQRWLHAPHPRSVSRIPPRRLTQLIEAMTPPPDTLAREVTQAAYAQRAIKDLELPREVGVLPSWKRQRWLEAHMVLVIEVKVEGQHVRQIMVSRLSQDNLASARRRGRVIDEAVVPTRFHATVLVHEVLTVLGPWRFQASAAQVAQGFTQTWLADAPLTHLSRMVDELDLR